MLSLKRRINRTTYIIGVLLIPLLALGLQIVLGTILQLIPGLESALETPDSDSNSLIQIIGIIFMAVYYATLLILVSYFLILVKQRSNDVSNHGVVVFVIAVLSLIGVLILAVIPGTKRQNNYGSEASKGLHLR